MWREPEGVAIYRTPRGETRLASGTGSRDSVGGSLRYCNTSYERDLVA